ncbi:MAG: SdrD B-like domain-containing protein [Chitinophagales bacterium]
MKSCRLIFSLLCLIVFSQAKAQINAGFTFSINNPSGCAAEVTFTDTSSGNITSWLWDFGDGTIGTIPNPTHVYNINGTYNVTLTVSDTNSQDIVTAQINITNVTPLDITVSTTNNTMCDTVFNCNGSISVTVNNGAPPYQYQWSNGMIGSPILGMCAGTYSVTVFDSNGCDAAAVATIIDSSIAAIDSTRDASCGSCDGYASVIPQGGTPPYQYTWSTGDTTSEVINLCPGFYDVTISDATGCQATDTFLLAGTCGSINGHVFEDLNGNGIKDAGEAGLAGVRVSLAPGGLFTYSDQNGDYSIGVGTFGNFNVEINAPTRYYCSGSVLLPDSISFPVGNNHSVDISVANPDSSGLDFGLIRPQSPCGTISGHVFDDLNGNGVQDAGEPGLAGMNIILSNGQQTQTDANGDYSVEVPFDSTIVLEFVPGSPSYFCGSSNPTYVQTFPVSPPTYTVSVSTSSPVSSGNDFGVEVQPFFDVGVYTIRSFSGIHAGQQFRAWMDYKWHGVTGNCTLRLEFDPLVNFVSAAITPDVVTNTYVEWIFPPQANGMGCMSMYFELDSSATAGTALDWRGLYTCGTPDACPGNDERTNTVYVQSGPLRRAADNGFNFMEVFHTGDAQQETISRADSVFSYVINFQNITDDTVYHLTIVDTISPHLDIESVSLPFASRPDLMEFHMPQPNILVWEFDGIMLPDSTTNLLQSYGFVQYNIIMKPGLPDGTVIENSAAIIFNHSASLKTNETQVTLEQGVGIEDWAQGDIINLYPNPTENHTIIDAGNTVIQRVAVTDINGKELYYKENINENRHRLNLDVPAGIYLVQIYAEEGMLTKKMVVK